MYGLPFSFSCLTSSGICPPSLSVDLPQLFHCSLLSITHQPTDEVIGELCLEIGADANQIERLVAALSLLVWELIKVRLNRSYPPCFLPLRRIKFHPMPFRAKWKGSCQRKLTNLSLTCSLKTWVYHPSLISKPSISFSFLVRDLHRA